MRVISEVMMMMNATLEARVMALATMTKKIGGEEKVAMKAGIWSLLGDNEAGLQR